MLCLPTSPLQRILRLLSFTKLKTFLPYFLHVPFSFRRLTVYECNQSPRTRLYLLGSFYMSTSSIRYCQPDSQIFVCLCAWGLIYLLYSTYTSLGSPVFHWLSCIPEGKSVVPLEICFKLKCTLIGRSLSFIL